MARKKKEVNEIKKDYELELASNPELSLIVDYQNIYGWNEQQKKFLEVYIQTKIFKVACEISGIDVQEASKFLVSYNAQKEIRRINTAMVQLQFKNKMASLEDIGGYLTSLLQGNSIQADQLGIQEKLDIVDLLLKVHKTQIDAVKEPQTIIARDLNVDFKNLSVKSLKTLIENYDSQDIDTIMNSNLSPEEIASLKMQGREIAEIVNTLDDNSKT